VVGWDECIVVGQWSEKSLDTMSSRALQRAEKYSTRVPRCRRWRTQSLNAARTGRRWLRRRQRRTVIKGPLWTANETDDSLRSINIATTARFVLNLRFLMSVVRKGSRVDLALPYTSLHCIAGRGVGGGEL